jgi:methionyl-tRNA formyltransferase
MTQPRIIFMGSPAFAVPILEELLRHRELARVVGVVTQPDKPAGRGRILTSPPVKLTATAHDLPVLQPAKMKAEATHQSLRELVPDLMIVAAYGRILPPAMLAIPRLGCINVHASLLPRHRGASPITHAILAGDAEAGVAIMRMEEGLDTGPVFILRGIPMPPAATTGSLSTTLAALGAELLIEALPGITAGTLTPKPQDHAAATYAPLLEKEHGKLDFAKPAVALERQIRAFQPWPGTFAKTGPQRLQILDAAVVPNAFGTPGQVLCADKHGVVVACGEGALRLVTIQPEGKKAMPAAAWVAGRGIAPGDWLT